MLFRSGYREATGATEAKIEKMAEAVATKARVNTILAEIQVPAELNDETVSEYLLAVEEVAGKVQDAEVSRLLLEYREKWADFKVVFASQDNALIQKTVAELREEAVATGKKIREVLDARITLD